MGEDAIQKVCISCQFNDNDNLILSQEELIADYTARAESWRRVLSTESLVRMLSSLTR